ncbi:hypothetical protein Tco_1290315 [Tanacetum coccineum]
MAQPQRPADVHQDELCLRNKRYALMDANKKVDLENPLCPDKSRILTIILQNHPLRISIAASSSVSWIYLGQTIFHLPQATNNNYDHFVSAPKFSEMVPFYINHLGFTLELRSTSNFKTTMADIMQDVLKMSDNTCYWLRLTIVADHADAILFFQQYLYALVLQDTLQVSLAKKKSCEELEDKQNVEKVKEHLMAEEIEKLVEGSENVGENVEVANSPLRNDDNQTNPDTRIEPRSYKERPEVEKIVDISQPVNVIKKDEESAEDDYELKRREKGKHVEEIRHTPSPTTIRSSRIQSTLVSSDTEKLQELTEIDPTPSSSTPSLFSPKTKLSNTNQLLSLFKSKPGHFR